MLSYDDSFVISPEEEDRMEDFALFKQILLSGEVKNNIVAGSSNDTDRIGRS